jgi:carboxyl-terminal processing protease
MIRPEVGYIRLTNFARTTHQEFLLAVASLRKMGMKSLIFDLRSNSGGYLDQAILMTNEFLPKGKLMVYTEDRWGNRQSEYSTGGGSVTDIPLVVLIDEYSASSSEILAGALQDNDRGTIVGRRSFGKGLVQTQIPLEDGSAIRLTVARYFTPTGRSIQKPYERGGDNYADDFIERYEHGELFSADSIHFADSLKFTTPKGKTVYGGGGIMPDVFVPIDTLNMTPYYYAATGLNILYRYALDYTDRHRQELDQITTLAEMEQFFKADKQLISNFYTYASRKGVAPKTSDIAKSKAVIEAQIKAYIARNTQLEDDAFYYFIAPIDDALQVALKELQ